MSGLGHWGGKRAYHGRCPRGLVETRHARSRDLWSVVLEAVLFPCFANFPLALAALVSPPLLAIVLAVDPPAPAAASPWAPGFREVSRVLMESLLG